MLEGSCLCGATRYQVGGFIQSCHACHCSNCKKFSGSAHSSVFAGLARNLTWLAGEENLSSFEADTPAPRVFCRHCGSPMPAVLANRMVIVPAGSLDKDPGIPLGFHLFTKYHPAWQGTIAEKSYEETMPGEDAIPIWQGLSARIDELGDDLVEFMRICDRTDGFRAWWDAHAGLFSVDMNALMQEARERPE